MARAWTCDDLAENGGHYEGRRFGGGWRGRKSYNLAVESKKTTRRVANPIQQIDKQKTHTMTKGLLYSKCTSLQVLPQAKVGSCTDVTSQGRTPVNH